MKVYSTILVCFAAATLIFSSCTKFLEERSQSELVPRSAQALNELLLGNAYQLYDATPSKALRFYHDDVEFTGYVEVPGTDVFYLCTWQPDKVTGSPFPWTGHYTMIQVCNTVLEYLPKVTGETDFKDYVAGQAHLLRAFYYFKLINFYGLPYTDKESNPSTNLGVPLMLASGVSLETKGRNTVEEVYQQIVLDVEKGIELMERSRVQHNTYRIGSVAGHLLASRIYLYMGRWSESVEHASLVLQQQNKLMDLRTWGPVNPQIKPVVGVTNPETLWAFGSAEGVNLLRTPDEVKNIRFSSDFLNCFEPGDLRKGIYFSDNYQNKVPPASQKVAGQAFRVSEAYLNRAEANAQLYMKGNSNSGQAAVDDLNTLRQYRFSVESYSDFVLPDVVSLIQVVRDERRRELFDEAEHRWFDLRRYGMPSIEHYYYTSASQRERFVLEERDPFYLLPIPDGSISLNPKIIQNPLTPVRQPK